MSKLQTKTTAAIAVTLLSLSVMSVAQAGQDGKDTAAVGITVKKQQQIPHRKIYNTNQPPFEVDRPTGPVPFSGRNLPPEFGPDFHGFNGA